jgi:cyclic beta-1,2-glucan synthetase
VIKPYLPSEWPQVSVRYRHGTATYDLDIRADGADGQGEVGHLNLDGRELAVTPDARIPLADDGNTHWVTVRIHGESNPRSDSASGKGDPAVRDVTSDPVLHPG